MKTTYAIIRRWFWKHLRGYAYEICDRCGRPGDEGSVCADVPGDPWVRERLELSSTDLLGLLYEPRAA